MHSQVPVCPGFLPSEEQGLYRQLQKQMVCSLDWLCHSHCSGLF